ncbi:MAG: glycosyltransferase [Granulosicoccus sp.]
MDTPLYNLSLSSGQTLRKMVFTLRAVVKRLYALRRWQQYDILYLQRELFPFGGLIVERWLKNKGVVLFYDYDDALFIKKASRYNKFATMLRSGYKTQELFQLVHCVVAGNDWLRDAAAKAGAARAVTLEVAEDVVRIPMHSPHSNKTPVTIGWLGSPSTVKYLRFIEPVLQKIASAYPVIRWEIMGGSDFFMEGVDWQISEWSLDGELEALSRFDIGLMPLPEEDWARGKSGGKARTYMAAGVVPVVSAIGYNIELVRDGVTGFLCANENQWHSALTQLINDAALRQMQAEAARADVEVRFNPASISADMAQLFTEVLKDVNGN